MHIKYMGYNYTSQRQLTIYEGINIIMTKNRFFNTDDCKIKIYMIKF